VREVFEETIMAEFVKHRTDFVDPHRVLAYLNYVERVWVGKVRCRCWVIYKIGYLLT